MPRPSKPHVSNGRWRFRHAGKTYWCDKADAPGAERRAKARWHEVLAEALADPSASDAPRTVNGAITAWLALRPADGCYVRWLREFKNFAGSINLRDVGRDLLARFHVHLASVTYRRKGKIVNRETGERAKLEPHKLAPETVRHWVRAAGSVLRWAHRQGWIREAPTVPELPQPMRQDRDVEAGKLWAIIDGLPERASRAQRILRFIAGTGCRPSEACRLQWADVHADAGVCMLAQHKTAKKSGKPRTVYLTDEAREALKGLKPAAGPVFRNRYGQPYTPGGLRAILRRHGRITPYQLRHSFAQQASESDVPVDVLARLLGHETTRTTSFCYSVRDSRAIGAARNLRLRPVKQTASAAG